MSRYFVNFDGKMMIEYVHTPLEKKPLMKYLLILLLPKVLTINGANAHVAQWVLPASGS